MPGNHIVLDLGNGVFAMFAHLKRRSARVHVGQEVSAGDLLAECGNSGNSTEPHLHFQLLDHPNVAAGLPMGIHRYRLEPDDPVHDDVSHVGKAFHADPLTQPPPPPHLPAGRRS